MTTDLRQRLRTALVAGLRAKDAEAVAVLRATLAAIDNAEAVDPNAPAPGGGHQHFAGSTAGLAATEAGRRHLTAAEIEGILRREIDDLCAAAAGYDRAGRQDQGQRLRAQADLLAGLLDPSAP